MTDNPKIEDVARGLTEAQIEELRQVIIPVIGACLLMRSNDPALVDPRIGVAAEVANAIANHIKGTTNGA